METCKHEIENCAMCDPTLAPETAPVRLPGASPQPRGGGVRYWSPEEDELARDLTIPTDELAEVLGRTPVAVHLYRYGHGYITKRHDRTVPKTPRSMVRWTTVEEHYMFQRFEEGATPEEVAQELGRTVAAIHVRANRS